MINITEIRPPRKLSGLSSILIDFNYNQQIIDLIKSFPVAYYHKKDYTWELSMDELGQVLDLLTFYDDINLRLLPDEVPQEINYTPLSEEEIAAFRVKPFQHQIEGINFGLRKNKWLLLDSMGLGKALALDTKIYTPTGYTTMGELRVGDTVFDENGEPCRVEKIFDHKNVEMYKIQFIDGTTVECCKDHLWQVYTHGETKVVDTAYLASQVLSDEPYSYNFSIPVVMPLQLTNIDLTGKIDPFLMGMYIGELCCVSDYHYSGKTSLNFYNGIPSKYLYNSYNIRLELLEGILSTAKKDEQGAITVLSKKVKDQIVELADITGRLASSETIDEEKQVYKVIFKKNLYNRPIVAIDKIKNSNARCITVNSKSHLYVVDNGIVTHNTNEIIWYAETLKKRGLIDHCLIICGVDSLRQNWKAEIKKFSTEDCIVLGEKISKNGKISYETVAKRAELLKQKINEFFVIINVAALRNEKIIKALTDKKSPNQFGLIALDEAHACSNKSSDQSAGLLKLKADYMVAATGTLLINSPVSCYMALYWTDNDHATLTNFKAQYCDTVQKLNFTTNKKYNQIIGYKNLDFLKEELNSCMIRRTLDEVRDDMPPQTLKTELIEMSDSHKKFYEAIKNGIKESVDKVNLNSANLLALTTRLRQATVAPSILTSENIMSSKLERCVEIVEDLVAQGEKVVIMSSFKEPVYLLAEMLKQYEPFVNTGDISDDVILQNMQRFQTDQKAKIFVGTLDKISTGVTLNAASYLIMLDEDWTAYKNNQAHDRIYRINNTRPAIIITLMCKDTIDERVHAVAQLKQDLSDFVVDDVDNYIKEAMRDEILAILSE